MKIKEVCARTGLTERAVRLYIEKGLLSPQKTWRREREYLDFSEDDLRRLEQIGLLRRYFFSLDEIDGMLGSPSLIGETIAERQKALADEAAAREEALKLFTALSGEHFEDVPALCARLRQQEDRFSRPPFMAQPDFGRLDEESFEEREAWASAAPSRRKRRRLKRTLLIGGLAAAAIAALAAGWGWYRDNRMGRVVLSSILELEVLDKGVDTNGEVGVYWLDAAVPEDAQAMGLPAQFRLTLGTGTQAYILWDGTVYGHSYPMARVEVFLPNKALREMGLQDASIGEVLQKVYSSEEYRRDYLRLTSFQGEY